jgi:creatinine amidohydrolase
MGILYLETMTSPEVGQAIADGHDTVVIPFGSLEQHGGHLPIGTDAMLGDEFGRRIAGRLNAFLVPTVRVGFADHHLPFAGTVSVSKDTLRRVAVDYAHGLARHGFRRIVFVPTHGGNFQPLVDAVEECHGIAGAKVMTVVSDFSRDVLREGTVGVSLKSGITPEESGAHAGEWETSIMLWLAPTLVRMNAAAPGYVGDMAEGVQRVLRDGVSLDQLSPNGVMGDPRKAQAERGELYIEALTNVALRVLDQT